jgi:S1-C subfamily serine protease
MEAELRLLDGPPPRAGQTFVLREDYVLLGRHPSCTVRFDPEQDREVSARHAALIREGGQWVLRDLGSSNGTWVNGERVSRDRTLRPGDELRLGPGGPRLRFGAAAAEPTVPPTRPDLLLPQGSTTARFRALLGRRIAPWRRATLVLATLLVALAAATGFLVRRREAALTREQNRLLDRADSLLVQLTETSGSADLLEQALLAARTETAELRAALAREAPSRARLDSLERALAASRPRAEAALRAARIDPSTAVREQGDPVGMVLSEFAGGRRVSGTGFAIRSRGDTAWIVTARHLVTGPAGEDPARLGIIFHGSSQNFRAVPLARSAAADLALLTVRVRGGVPVVRGLGLLPAPGDPVAVLGYPFGFADPPRGDWRTAGVSVSGLAGTVRASGPDRVEIEAFGTSGSSGSPVFNTAGEVVAVVFGGDPAAFGRILYAVPAGVIETLFPRNR